MRTLAIVLFAGCLGCALVHERAVDAHVDAPPTPEMLCAATGGHWRHGPCCPTECGLECPLACISSNCACAPDQVWDETLGCVHSPMCMPMSG
jgi:hypothetical protein